MAAACSIYDADVPRRPDGGAAAGNGGTSPVGGGANAGAGGSAGSGTGGTSGGAGGATDDAGNDDATFTDAAPLPPDARRDGDGGADTGSPDDAGPGDISPPADGDTLDGPDAAISADGSDADDGGPPLNDGSSDAPGTPDVDATTRPDADGGTLDVSDGGPTGPQILPPHGSPIENPDAGGPFDSRCASDEVVTGFIGRAGVQTDAIASTCSKLIGGVLSSPRNLPLNGNLTGGNPFTVTCPANYVAVSIVGRYGHNTMWMEDVTTMIGVLCKDLASAATQTVTITGQPALDAGYTSFREDCTGGRYLTDISGRTDSNSLGFTVQQVGGECNVR